MAVKFLFPLLEAFHECTALHGDQHGIVKAVIVEFGQGLQIVGIFPAFKYSHNAMLQAVCDFFHFVSGIVGGKDNRLNRARLKNGFCRSFKIGFFRVGAFRLREAHSPVFLRYVAFAPVVPL